MGRGKLDLVMSNTSTRNSSPTNKPRSQKSSSQPVIKIFLLLVLVSLLCANNVIAAWANSSFDRCKNITINNSGSETLTDFPAYINLTYDSDMLTDFKDIRFYNASCNNDGVLLDYEIENYTTSTNAHIWTRIPTLTTPNVTISVYYKNNTAVTSGENPTGVWDSNYKAVWHMQKINATDSTNNANHGTQSGGVTLNSTGKIDGADEFNRSQDINITENTPLNFTGAFSYGAWWKKNNWNNTYGGIFTRNLGPGETNEGYSLVMEDYNHVSCYYGNGTKDEHVISDDPDISTNTWYYTECVWNGSTMLIYVNGVKQADKGTLTIKQSNYSAYIGRLQLRSTSYRWNGSIDEVRVSNTARSDSWINMSYRIVANQSSYVSFGEEQSQVYINITLILNPNPVLKLRNVSIYGHVNQKSDGTNVTNNTINIYINNSMYYLNNNTGLLENTTTTWWNTSFAYRTKIYITSQVSTTLNKTIVLANLSTTNLISQGKMRTDCGDTRFTDTNNNELQYTTETSTCNTTNTLYWIWMNLTGNTNNTIYAYYGNSTATLPTSYTNPDDKLILYYHFDNNSAYGENSTKLFDFSKYGHNAACTVCPTWNSTGKYGGAYSYDGNLSQTYFDTGYDASWTNTSNYSIGFWMRPNMNNTGQGIIGKTSTEWRTRIDSIATFRFTHWASSDFLMMESDNIPANQWTHMFITYNGSVGKLYRNAVEVATDSPIGEFIDTSGTVYIGAAAAGPDTGSYSNYFNGSIDEVRIYNRTLSADEILAIYNSTRPNDIQNHSLPRTDSYGNYNYTFTAPSTPGNYEVKVNTTYNNSIGENTATLTVNSNPINITLSLNPNSTLTLRNVSITGHVNESDGTNVTNNAVNIYINNSYYCINNNTGLLENATQWWNTNFAYRTKIYLSSSVTTNLNNTITLVNLSTSDLISQGKMRTDCGDTRFADANGNELQYTLETSTCNTTNTLYWIWMNLTGNTNNTIYAYYGNSATTTKTDYTNPDDKLILYYHFDNNSAYGENSTKLFDFSKYGHNAACTVCPTWNSTGKYGGAYSYDGNLSQTYFDTGYDASWTNTSNYSIGFWMRPNMNNTGQGIIGTTSSTEWRTRIDSIATFRFTHWASSDFLMMESDNIPANQWTHMFITYNGSVGKLYRNGTQVATDSPIGEFYDWSETVYIGAATASPDTGTWTDYFNGSIDEVRIYNRALSADEILAIYNSTAPYYISNHSLPRTDSNGNYNYTYTTPSTAGNYEVKVNTTYNSMHAEATATLTVNANDSCTCPGVGTSWIIDMSHSCNITSDCDITTGYLNFTSTGYVRFNATINCTGMQKPSADQIIYIDKNCVLKVH